MQKIAPFVLADKRKPKAEVEYHSVPLPSTTELRSACSDLEWLQRRIDAEESDAEAVDVTRLADLCMRFTCLAYRRNAVHGQRLSAASCEPCNGGLEIQLNASGGAHAVLYLLGDAAADEGGRRLVAILSFKGSTANLQDWRANLQNSHEPPAPLIYGNSAAAGARVHSGWLSFLNALIGELERFELSRLPSQFRTAWRLPSTLSLWALLMSRHCFQVFCVGQ